MKALKAFIDANQKTIKRGQPVKKSDYRKEVWDVMIDHGLVKDEPAQDEPIKPSNNKMATPKNKKAKK